MSFSAHLPVDLPQRASDQLAPLENFIASISLGMSAPSFLANPSASKLAEMHDHNSRLLIILAICPLPDPPR